jgi:transcriptional regulator with XRE-family HTH domain
MNELESDMTDRAEAAAGVAIRDRLRELGMSEPELVRRAPVDSSTLASLLRGAPRKPSRVTRDKIERALSWPDGTLLALIEGTIKPEEVKTVTIRQTGDSPEGHVTLELDIPLGVWDSLDDLQRLEALHTASAAALRRVNEFRQSNVADRPPLRAVPDDHEE